MQLDLLEHLDPARSAGAERLLVFEEEGGHILEGAIHSAQGEWFPVTRGVPCFLRGAVRPDWSEFALRHGLAAAPHAVSKPSEHEAEQARTTITFSDKWRRFKRYGFEPGHQQFFTSWFCKKLGLASIDALKGFYRSKQAILEVGPGSGFNTRYMAENTAGTVIAADISEGAFVAFDNTRHLPNCHVIQADLMDLPFQSGAFDFIIADGVLHHTPNTRDAVEALYRLLKPGGQFFFYVYKKMGAARQFCDQHIRAAFSQLSPEECFEACEGLTELGRELAHLDARITLTKPIPILDIPAGTHDVQRLFYYNFVKCFWNEAFDFETNNMVNYDWYHPHNAWQHDEYEVTSWLADLGVVDYSFQNANPNGLSVLLRKPVSWATQAA